MPFLALPSLQLFYEQQGASTNPPVLLLHALGSSAADWALQVPVLQARYAVVAVDLRAHGRSGAGRGWLRVEQMAEDVSVLLTHLAAPPAHVVGLSLGGCVAQRLAIQHPTQVRSLTLVNSFARLQLAGRRGVFNLAKRLWLVAFAPMPAVAAWIATGLFPYPHQQQLYQETVNRLGRNPKGRYINILQAAGRFDARRDLGGIRCPVCLVVGDRDTTIARAAQAHLRHALPHAQWHLIPDSGHATPYDQPELFNRVLLDFLSAC